MYPKRDKKNNIKQNPLTHSNWKLLVGWQNFWSAWWKVLVCQKKRTGGKQIEAIPTQKTPSHVGWSSIVVAAFGWLLPPIFQWFPSEQHGARGMFVACEEFFSSKLIRKASNCNKKFHFQHSIPPPESRWGVHID